MREGERRRQKGGPLSSSGSPFLTDGVRVNVRVCVRAASGGRKTGGMVVKREGWRVAGGRLYATESGGDVNEVTDSSFLLSLLFLLFRRYGRCARLFAGFSVGAVRVCASLSAVVTHRTLPSFLRGCLCGWLSPLLCGNFPLVFCCSGKQ